MSDYNRTHLARKTQPGGHDNETEILRTAQKNRHRWPTKTLLVWDLPVRIFHSSMVLVVGVAAITGFLASTWSHDIQVIAGYTLTTLLVFRLIWGFAGSRYSQFKTFPLVISGALQHLRELMRFTSHPVIGHKPVGVALGQLMPYGIARAQTMLQLIRVISP